MSDIFLSYANDDRARVGGLVRALERHGWSVWWDTTIPPGKTYDQVIDAALDAARCVVVVWSRASVASRWVRTEAEEGLQRDVLVPVLIEDIRLPIAFRRIQAARLVDWQDSGPHPEFERLLQAVTDLIGPPASVAAASPGVDSPLPPPSEVLPPGDQAPAERLLQAVTDLIGPPASVVVVSPGVEPPIPPQSEVLPPGDQAPPVASPRPQRPPQTVPQEARAQPPGQATTLQTRPGRRRRVWLGGVVGCVFLAVLYAALPTPPSREVPDSAPGPTPVTTSLSPSEPAQLQRTITNSLGMEFVLIPSGEFSMGSANGENDEVPVHTVRISQAFYLGTYEVTQGQWQAVMGSNPSQFPGDPQRPVEQVSWEDVQTFMQKLNAKEGGTLYKLPTEAEWEYAARAGTTTAYSFGDDAAQLGEYAWYEKNAGKTTYPVGQRKPNAWGLYDMHGNVWEWVQDWYGAYAVASAVDPQGPAAGAFRVFRGGGWFYDAGGCRSASRYIAGPGYRGGLLGVRLLRTAR